METLFSHWRGDWIILQVIKEKIYNNYSGDLTRITIYDLLPYDGKTWNAIVLCRYLRNITFMWSKTFVETAACGFCFWCVSGCDHFSVLVASWWPRFNQRLVWQQVRAAREDKDAHCSTSLCCQWPRPHLEAHHWSRSEWVCVWLAENEDKTQSGGGGGEGRGGKRLVSSPLLWLVKGRWLEMQWEWMDGLTDKQDTVAATTTKYCATVATGQHWSSFRKCPSLLPLQDFPGTAAWAAGSQPSSMLFSFCA